MRIGTIIIGLIVFFGGIVAMSFGTSQENIIAPCVDGDGDINLEGIMCDKNIYYVFGINQSSFEGSSLVIISILMPFLGGIIILMGVLGENKK